MQHQVRHLYDHVKALGACDAALEALEACGLDQALDVAFEQVDAFDQRIWLIWLRDRVGVNEHLKVIVNAITEHAQAYTIHYNRTRNHMVVGHHNDADFHERYAHFSNLMRDFSANDWRIVRRPVIQLALDKYLFEVLS